MVTLNLIHIFIGQNDAFSLADLGVAGDAPSLSAKFSFSESQTQTVTR